MRHSLAVITLAALALSVTGCARTVVKNPVNTDYNPSDTTGELDFWHGLPGQSAVSNDEAFHGVLLMFDGADPTMGYDNRVAALKERGWLSKKFDESADLAMQRGTLAYILVRAMDVKGGVMMFLTDRSARYANLELQRIGVMPAGSELMVLDGLDYVGTMSKAQDFMVVKGLDEAEGIEEIRPAAPQNEAEEVDSPDDPEPG